ncbi:hypothetical protein [Dickeya oryzae]
MIIYDDSGEFTLNERRAAWSEAYTQDQAWRQHIVTQACLNYCHPHWQIQFFYRCIEKLPFIARD